MIFHGKKGVDKKLVNRWKGEAEQVLKKELEQILNEKKFQNYELIEGDIRKTLQIFRKGKK